MIGKWILNNLLSFIGTQKSLIVQLDITNACNLSCRHCYQSEHSGGADIPLHSWIQILDQFLALASKLHLTPNFCLSGGEPTISPLFLPILNEIRGRCPGAEIAVLTNGTDLREDVVRGIAKANAKVQLSLEGPDPDTHDYVRGRGSFSRTMGGLQKLQDSGAYVTFQAVLSKRTASLVDAFFELASLKRVAGMNFARFVAQGRGREFYNSGDDRPLYKEELRDAYVAIVAASRHSCVYTSTNRPLFVLVSPELGAHNNAGFQGLIIDYQGNLKVSSRTDFKLGNVLESGLEELFLKHPLMVNLRKGTIEGCSDCSFFKKCGGDRNASFEAHGTFFKKDPGCWL